MKRIRLPSRATMVAALALSASVAAGGVGDLTYAKSLPPGVSASTSGTVAQKVSDPADLGLTHPDARVATVGPDLKVAFDAEDPKAELLDLARIDLTGKGDFKNAKTVKLKTSGSANASYRTAMLAPLVVEMTKDGKKMPVVLAGRFVKRRSTTYASVGATLAATGRCDFDGTARKVLIIDQNRNAVLGDVVTRKVGTREMKNGDRVLIADESGKYGSSPYGGLTAIGQPTQVAGKWFTLGVDAMKVKASPLAVPMGALAVNAPQWDCLLYRQTDRIAAGGGSKPTDLPAGEYRRAYFRLFSDADAGTKAAYLSVSLNKPLKIDAGETTKLPLGSDLTVTAQAALRDKGQVRLSAQISDSAGSRVIVYGAGGRRPEAPQIEVINKAGKVVYTAKLAYG